MGNYGSERKYVFKYQGINSRMSELDAAVLDVKLNYLDEDNAKRQALADFYYRELNNPLVRLPRRLPDAQNVYHLFPCFANARRVAGASGGLRGANLIPLPHRTARTGMLR